MTLKYIGATVMIVAALTFSAAAMFRSTVQIYAGRDLDETLSDVREDLKLVSHELSSATPLLRTDVFRLPDGRLLAITSRAAKLGQPYTIKTLRITPTAGSKLTNRLPPRSFIEIRLQPE